MVRGLRFIQPALGSAPTIPGAAPSVRSRPARRRTEMTARDIGNWLFALIGVSLA